MSGRLSDKVCIITGTGGSIRIEAFGDLHEFGGLGKLVTAKEAAALV